MSAKPGFHVVEITYWKDRAYCQKDLTVCRRHQGTSPGRHREIGGRGSACDARTTPLHTKLPFGYRIETVNVSKQRSVLGNLSSTVVAVLLDSC